MTDDNIWLIGRLRELASLDAILQRLASDPDTSDPNGPVPNDGAVQGAGTAGRTTVPISIDTSGAHAALLHARHGEQEQP